MDHAAISGHWEFTSALLKAKARHNLSREVLQKLFNQAIENKDVGAAQVLLAMGCDVLCYSYGDRRPWQLAFDKGAGENMLHLLKDAEMKVLAVLEC